MLNHSASVDQDIAPDERIVYSYDTRLTYTEQGDFLDGLDTPDQREQGMGGLLEALGRYLESESANP